MSSRTHIVDLGIMPREQLIEVAKKQANQIREKNLRIAAMETFIESVTGASAEESLQWNPSAYTAAVGSSASLSCAGGGAAAGPSPSPSTYPQSTPGTVPNSAQLAELRQLLEEEQVQHTIRVSELESQLRERQAEYDALQAKVGMWKAKVMAAMTADQERIKYLEGQLSSFAFVGSSNGGISQGPSTDTASSFPTAPTEDDEVQQATLTAKLVNQVATLTSQLQEARAPLQQATYELHSQPPAASRESSMAAEVVSQTPRPEAAPSSDHPPPDPYHTAPTPSSTSIPPEVLDAAVHAKLETWKERVKTTMMEHKRRIEELEEQLAAAQQERETAVSAAAAERESEAEALRADVARLETQLTVALGDRDAAEEKARAEWGELTALKDRAMSARVDDQTRIEEREAELREAKQEASLLRSSLEEHQAVAVGLRADLARVEEQLNSVQKERDALAESSRKLAAERDEVGVVLTAFRAKMEAWKVKVRTVVEDRERERDALSVRVQQLMSEVALAQRKAEGAGADAAAAREEVNGLQLLLDAERAKWTGGTFGVLAHEGQGLSAQSDAMMETRQAAVFPMQMETGLAAVANTACVMPSCLPNLPRPPDSDKLQRLLSECDRLAAENVKLRHVVTELLRFKKVAMEEVRAAGVAVQNA